MVAIDSLRVRKFKVCITTYALRGGWTLGLGGVRRLGAHCTGLTYLGLTWD